MAITNLCNELQLYKFPLYSALPIFVPILLDLLTQLNPFVLNQGTPFILRLFLQKKCSFSLLSFCTPQEPQPGEI